MRFNKREQKTFADMSAEEQIAYENEASSTFERLYNFAHELIDDLGFSPNTVAEAALGFGVRFYEDHHNDMPMGAQFLAFTARKWHERVGMEGEAHEIQ